MDDLAESILAIYRKHGWKPTEALVETDKEPELLPELKQALQDIPVRPADFSGIWFERPSHDGNLAVELRLLSPEPYAIFELVADDEIQDVKNAIEQRMAEHSSRG